MHGAQKICITNILYHYRQLSSFCYGRLDRKTQPGKILSHVYTHILISCTWGSVIGKHLIYRSHVRLHMGKTPSNRVIYRNSKISFSSQHKPVNNLEIFWTYLLICIIRTDGIQTIYSTLTRLKTNLISLKLHVTYFLWEFQLLSLILFDILYFNKR